MSASALPGENRPSAICVEVNEKTSINSVYPDLWPQEPVDYKFWLSCNSTCVYQVTFRNVYEFKKWLVKSEFVWSRTLPTLLPVHREIVSVPAFAQRTDISSNFTAGSWKRKQLNETSGSVSKNVNKMCFCAIFRLSYDTTLNKNVIFRWFCIPQVGLVQKQTLGEVENWMVICWPVVSEVFVPKNY